MVQLLIHVIPHVLGFSLGFLWGFSQIRARVRDVTTSHRRRWRHMRNTRNDLLDGASRCAARGEFRERKSGESLWTYAKVFDHWADDRYNVPPSSDWSDMDSYAPWTFVQTYWWSTEYNGLMHQVVALKQNNEQWYVLRCDHDTLVGVSTISEHPIGTGPLLTCVRCFGMSRHG